MPVDGDFRSSSSGAWNDYNIWQRYATADDTWVPAVEGEIPSSENSVFIEANDSVVLTENQSCKDLHLNGAIDVNRLNLQENTLEVWGKLRFYSGTAPGTDLRPGGGAPGQWIQSDVNEIGRIKFRGSSDRVIMENSSMDSADGLAAWVMEFAFDEGAVGTITSQLRVGNLIVSSGKLVHEGPSIRPTGSGVNGGTIGFIQVMDGGTLQGGTQGFFRSSSKAFWQFILDEGANLIVTRSEFDISAFKLIMDGTVTIVNDNALISQNLPDNGGRSGAKIIEEFNNLIIAGPSQKILKNNTIVNGILKMQDNASFEDNGFTISYGEQGSLEYSGTSAKTTTDIEFPADSSPNNLIINNPKVNLHADRKIEGELKLENGIFNLNGTNFTLGAESPPIAGNFSSQNMVIPGSGELRKIFSSVNNYFFPVGEDTGTPEFSPGLIFVNEGSLDVNSYVGVGAVDQKHPDDISPNDFISRYWPVTTNIDDGNFDGVFTYLDEDINGDEGSINSYLYTAGTGVPLSITDEADNQLSIESTTSVGDFSGSNFCGITSNNINLLSTDTLCTTEDPDIFTGSDPVVLSGTVNYQWQVRIDSGAWNAVDGAIDMNFNPSAFDTPGFYEYRRLVTTSDCPTSNISNIIDMQVIEGVSNNNLDTPSETTFCGTSTGFTIEGSSPSGGEGEFNFQWQRRFNDGDFTDVGSDSQNFEESELTQAGIYEYRRIVKSGTCNEGDTSNLVAITLNEEIVIAGTIAEATNGNNDGAISIEVTGGEEPFTFSWSNGADTQNLTNIQAGEYTVAVTDQNGCETMETFTVGQVTGLEDNELVSSYKIYPNPVTNKFYIQSKFTEIMDIKISIVNALGKVVFKRIPYKTDKLDLAIDFTGLPKGFYFIRTELNGDLDIRKIIKE